MNFARTVYYPCFISSDRLVNTFASIDKGYLKKLELGIFGHPRCASQDLLEKYLFSFVGANPNADNEAPARPGTISWHGNWEAVTGENTQKQTMSLLRSLIITGQSLEELKPASGEAHIQLKIYYTRSTPAKYETDNFTKTSPLLDQPGEIDEQVRFTVGHVQTKHHAMKLAIKTNLESICPRGETGRPPSVETAKDLGYIDSDQDETDLSQQSQSFGYPLIPPQAQKPVYLKAKLAAESSATPSAGPETKPRSKKAISLRTKKGSAAPANTAVADTTAMSLDKFSFSSPKRPSAPGLRKRLRAANKDATETVEITMDKPRRSKRQKVHKTMPISVHVKERLPIYRRTKLGGSPTF